jgi:hypothetical protein
LHPEYKCELPIISDDEFDTPSFDVRVRISYGDEGGMQLRFGM